MAAPMTDATPRLVAWRARVAARPAVREVLDALVAYLEREGLPVPAFARRAA
jgi:glutathione S-transferase